jgi:hypothetical protein
MGLFNKLFGNTPPEPMGSKTPEMPKVKKPRAEKTKKSDKDLATEKGEPYIDIISVELDPDNIGNGAFELDWNDLFVAKLVRSGYKGKDDAQIVDQWFQDVCRNVVLETFEQYEANNPRPTSGIKKRDLGDGRSEVS